MTNQDPYAELAQVYDDWQYLYPQPFCLALRPRLTRVLEEFSVPCETYADLGCGTGIFAAWWKQRFPDWQVFGLDQSPAMIAQARKTATRGAQKQALMQWGLSSRSMRAASFEEMMAAAESMQAGSTPGTAAAAPDGPQKSAGQTVPEPDKGPERTPEPAPSRSGVEFHEQALDGISLPVPVGLATCLFDGINHITRAPDLAAAFRSVHDALAPGGLFVFDLVHEDVFSEAFDGAIIRQGPGIVVTADSIRFTRGGTLFGRTTFVVFREESEGWERYDAEISERCWRREEVRDALESAGLALLRQDDVDPEVETEFQLPRTFWVCRRPVGGDTR